MNPIARIKDLIRSKPTDRTPRGETTLISSGDLQIWNNLLNQGDLRRQEVLKKYRTVYRNGGIIRTALDTYLLFMFAGGWSLKSDENNQAILDDIRDTFFARTTRWNQVIRQATLDAISIGDGYAKILKGGGRYSNTPVGLQHIPAERVKPHINETLTIEYYSIRDRNLANEIARIEVEDMLHICLAPGGEEPIGIGLLESAWDDIRHDVEISEGITAAIRRHGYGIWHAKVSSSDPDIPVRAEDVRKVQEALKTLSSRSEVVTTSTVEIVPLNETGQTNIGNYSEWSVIKLCTALGIPGELLGLRQGTTDATAVSRIENYYKKIQTYQEALADTINTQFIDRMLISLGKPAGSVWIEYADPSPEDDVRRADYLTRVAAITPGDPHAIMSQQQMQNYLGIDHKEWAKDEEYEQEDKEEPEPYNP